MSDEKCDRGSWTVHRLLSLKVLLPGFLSLVLLASIVIVSQFENIQLNKDLKPSLSNRKLQAAEVNASNATDTKNDAGLKAIKPKSEISDRENINYRAIIKQLLKDNYELQQRFNETLAVLQKCIQQKSVGCNSPKAPNCVNSDIKAAPHEKKDILPTTTSTSRKSGHQKPMHTRSNQRSKTTTAIGLDKSAKIQTRAQQNQEQKTDVSFAINIPSSNKTVIDLPYNGSDASVLKDLAGNLSKLNSTNIL